MVSAIYLPTVSLFPEHELLGKGGAGRRGGVGAHGDGLAHGAGDGAALACAGLDGDVLVVVGLRNVAAQAGLQA
jgi:hypothetical protein